jgi:flagella basal body P-ring formation protein FlgA
MASRVFMLLFALGLGWASETDAAGAAAPADVVVISFKAAATVGSRVILVKDVAFLEGGEPALQRKIGALDLNDPLRPGQSAWITARRLLYRFRMAGIDGDRFQIAGASEILVSAGGLPVPANETTARIETALPASTASGYRVSEAELIREASQLIRRRIPEKGEDLAIRVAQPIRSQFVANARKEDVRLDADLRSTSAPLGRVRVDVAIWAKDCLQATVPIYLEVKLSQWVAVAIRRIEPDEALSHENVRFERLPVDGTKSLLSTEEGLAGKKAGHALLPGQMLSGEDVKSLLPENPILVKSFGLVKIVTRVGGMKLTILGEAVQDGRAGQLIRVRNLSSKNVVLGRVVDRSFVEVEQ